MFRRGSFGLVIWVIIGIFVAVHFHYNSVADVSHILSFALAIALWPLLYLGIGLHIG